MTFLSPWLSRPVASHPSGTFQCWMKLAESETATHMAQATLSAYGLTLSLCSRGTCTSLCIEIRTLDGLLAHSPLAKVCLKPLGQLSCICI